MKVILIKNILHNGDRVLAGQEIELSDSMAKRLIETGSAYCQEPIQPTQDDEDQGSQDEQQDADDQGSQDEQSAKKSGGKKGK